MAEGGCILYTCDICGEGGLNEDDMKSHVLIEHIESSIYCPFCDLQGTTLEEMNWHINAEHLEFMSPVKERLPDIVTSNLPHQSMQEDTMGNGRSRCKKSAAAKSIEDDFMETEEKDLKPKYDKYTGSTFDEHENVVESDQVRKRAKLHLDVIPVSPRKSNETLETKKVVNCDVHISNEVDPESDKGTSSSSPQDVEMVSDVENTCYSCPLCDWVTASPDAIQQHVNDKHLDIISPESTTTTANTTDNADVDSENNILDTNLNPKQVTQLYECPLCSVTADNSLLMEVHVNNNHGDILSPKSETTTSHQGVLAKDKKAASPEVCPMCSMEFPDLQGLASHVDGHFSSEQTPVNDEVADNMFAQEMERREREAAKQQEEKDFEKLKTEYGMDSSGSYKQQGESHLEKEVGRGNINIAEYYNKKIDLQQAQSAGIDDGHSSTKGVMVKLRQFYALTNYSIKDVWLASDVTHYASSYADKGWGCGYRNLQMLLSSLATSPTYEEVLFNGRPLIPSIPKIQRLIEAAWIKGFDVQGAGQLGNQLVNTKKWIGATEIVATLSSLKIKCQLLDFHAPSGPNGSHPRLFQWVRDYFAAHTDFKPPLFFQHQGHSRTIVGIEEVRDNSLRMLIFDPSQAKKQMQQFHENINGNVLRTIRRTVHGMKAKQYQIVAVVGVLSDEEYEASKVLKSDRIA
ncbi:unnamed protein product [Owenia fusiformis]|uniref:Zinc finger-containing ubiquitin peptidase 1 n=1 Tax=Owenia fusiformis TaxID=6347 RepID=A0A8J1TCS7_OWEFU|nr:unnamed protein product [Owenia fusiformis]